MAAETLRFHFNALPSSVRKRFVDCIALEDEPHPLFSQQKGWKADLTLWALLAAAGLAVVGGTAWADFGRWANGPWSLLFYVLGLFCLTWGAAGLLWRTRLQKQLPWWPGTYVFPMNVVDANTERLVLYPIAGLTDLKAVHHHTNGSYTHTAIDLFFGPGEQVSLHVSGRELAEQLLADLAAADKRVAAAARAEDIGALADLDPFFEARIADDWRTLDEPKTPLAPGSEAVGTMPKLLAAPLIACLVASVVLGPGVWAARNLVNDVVMYNEAAAQDDVWAYERYLRRSGYLFGAYVRETALPRARWLEVKESRSVSRLRAFRAEFPDSAYASEAEAEIHALYEETRTAFRERIADPVTETHLVAMLTYLEEHGSPEVDVRFRAPSNVLLEEIDGILDQVARDVGVGRIEPISDSYSDEKMIPRERAIAERLQEGFSGVVANDILQLDHASRIPEEVTTFERPTLEVVYAVAPSDVIYTNSDPLSALGGELAGLRTARHYVGIVVSFSVRLHVPGSEDRLELDLMVEPPEHFTVEYTDFAGLGILGGGPSTSQVYDVMALRAFDQLRTRLSEALLGS